MKKTLVILLILAVAGGVFAQDAGTWSVSGWARANFGWDIENEAGMPKPDGDWDATGTGATVKYSKGDWTVAGEGSVTTADFGGSYGGSANITTTYAPGDWSVAAQVAQDFITQDYTGYFSFENWKQDDNDWGVKGRADFIVDYFGLLPFNFVFQDKDDDNKGGLFINFYEKKILFETGFGDYTGGAAWGTPGPYEYNLETADDEDSLLRLQFKEFVPGLNFGFAYLPGTYHDPFVNGGWTIDTFPTTEPAETIRATTLGVKYAPTDNPLVLALGLNLKKDDETAYIGGSYKLLDKKLTLSLDGKGERIREFGDYGLVNAGIKGVYVDNPDDTKLEFGLPIKGNNLVHNVAGESAKDLQVVVEPYVWYEFIDKVARAKLAFSFTKGLGDADERTVWTITPSLGWSLKETPSFDPDDIGTGFVVKYIYGQSKDLPDIAIGQPAPDIDINELYFGFKASF
jgi:hypothetical protein